ncbi:hypothetical protein LG634_33550 [Streptomyces bambusae]|uniref:hypothetical protein n=1 Tax=Streptomyces bambusae TaxID=1550616 RepID=UPI001CFFE7FC|nr:hypothetical protein [Streptomyces bambusae]MCB5169713.1 hypothetical protein [Streptomyces bambusae]
MSDAAQPTAAEVRAAAEAVKAALDRHLAAVEGRTGDDDPAVYAAFNELAAAAEEYDELLYDCHDEVTPFEIPAGEDAARYAGPAEPGVFSVLIRRDYVVVEPKRLVAQAELVAAADPDLGHEAETTGTADALGVLFNEYEPDEIASRHQEFGLEEGDATLWIATAEEPAEPGEWLNTPFDHTDPERILHRFEFSSVFDEGADDHDDDLPAPSDRR